ncbi:MAG: MarR family winged helix-turn-helix transcriptional regulator [Thalassovita sp.]
MKQNDPYRLHQSLSYHLSVAARLQERRLDEQLKTLGLSRATWCILLAVGNEDLSQPSDIADFVGIDRTATSRALRKMEDDGLLGRSSGTEDKRTRQVELTDKGCEAIAQATPFARNNSEILDNILTKDEAAELWRLLSKIEDSADNPLKTL